MEKEIALSRLTPDYAAELLVGCETLDPTGLTEARDLPALTHTGQCFSASSGDSQAVYVLRLKNGVAWIEACKGAGLVPWSDLLFPVIEAQAKGCHAVAFQTKSRGLVRRAKRQGYTVTGWILKKELHA